MTAVDTVTDSESGAKSSLLARITRAGAPQILTMSGQLVAGVGNLVVSMLFARVLMPGDYAIFVSFLAAYVLIHMVGASVTAAVAIDPSLHRRLFRRGLLVGVLVGGGLAALSGVLSPMLNLPVLAIVLLGVSCPSAILLALARGRLYGTQRVGGTVATLCTEPFGRGLLGLLLVGLIGPTGAAAGVVAAGYAALLVATLAGRSRRTGSVDGEPARRSRDSAAVTIAFLLVGVIASQDAIFANRWLEPGEAGVFAAVATIGGAAYFATATIPMVLSGSKESGRSGLLVAVGVAAGVSLGGVAVVALLPPSVYAAVLGDHYSTVGGFVVPYVGAMAALGIGRVLMAQLCKEGRGRIAALLALLAVAAQLVLLVPARSAGSVVAATCLGTAVLLVGSALAQFRRTPAAPARAVEDDAAAVEAEADAEVRTTERVEAAELVGALEPGTPGAAGIAGPASGSASGSASDGDAVGLDHSAEPAQSTGPDHSPRPDQSTGPAQSTGPDHSDHSAGQADDGVGRGNDSFIGGTISNLNHRSATINTPVSDEHDEDTAIRTLPQWEDDPAPGPLSPVEPTPTAQPEPRPGLWARIIALWPLWLAMAIGIGLRAIVTRSIWVDEAISIQQVQASYPDMIRTLLNDDVHPPLFHTVLWALVHLTGSVAEPIVRLPSLLAGIACIPVSYAMARDLWPDRRTAVVIGFVVAVAPVAVWYSQESRMYGMWMLGATILAWAQIRIVRDLRNGTGYGAISDWAAFTVLTVGMFYLQWFTALPILTQHLIFLVAAIKARKPRFFRNWILSGVIQVLMVAPLVPYMIGQFSSIISAQGSASAPSQTGTEVDQADNPDVYAIVANAIWSIWGYHADTTMIQLGAFWPVAVLLCFAALGRRRDRDLLVVLLIGVVPAAMLFGIGFERRQFFELRYFTSTVPMMLIMVGRVAATWGRGPLTKILLPAVTIASLGIGLVDQQVNQSNPRVYDFRGAVAWVKANSEPGDVVLYAPNFLRHELDYYPSGLTTLDANSAHPSREDTGMPAIPEDGRRVFVFGSFLSDPKVAGQVGGVLADLKRTEGTEQVGKPYKVANVTVWEFEQKPVQDEEGER